MGDGGQIFFVIVGVIIRTIIGGWIGSKHKCGTGWGVVLGLFLGLIGWIIAACSGKPKTMFEDMSKGNEQ